MTSNAPNAMAAESAVRQIGAEFRRLRGLRGERIEDIATYLDIKATYLFGIEQGDLSVIPSQREAQAVVRSYASYLGLDGEGIIGPMDPIIASLEGDNAPPAPSQRSWIDRTSAMILLASVILGVLVGWSWIGDVDQFDLLTPPVTANDLDVGRADLDAGGLDDDPLGGVASDDLSGEAADAADALLAELKTALEDGDAAETGEAEPNAVDASSGIEVSNGVDASTGADVSTGVDASTERVADPANVLAALVAQRGDGAHIYEAENTDARVIVRALDDVSVQVTSRSRDYVWTRTMRPREMLLVPNREDLELWTSDAAGIELLLDGVILPPLGPAGTVIGELSLASASLEAILETLPEGSAEPTF